MKTRNFVTKLVDIEAIQFDGTEKSGLEIEEWTGELARWNPRHNPFLDIETKIGIVKIKPGDFVVLYIDKSYGVYEEKDFLDNYEEK